MLVGLSLGLAAAPALASSRVYFAEYKGDVSYDYVHTYPGSPSGSLTDDLTFSWDEKVYANDVGAITQRTLVAQGTFKSTGTGSSGDPGSNYTCMIRQRAGQDVGDLTVQPGNTVAVADVAGQIPIFPGPAGDVVFSPVTDPSGSCPSFNVAGSVLNWNADGSASLQCARFAADPEFVPGVSLANVRADGYSRAYDATQSPTAIPGACSPTDEVDSGTRSIHATLTVGAGGPPVHHKRPLADPERTRQKLLAKVDLHQALRTGPDLCGQAVIGLSALWGGSAGVPLTPAQTMTATEMLAAAGPGCAAELQRIYDDFQIINDPPDSHVSVLARPRLIGHSAALPGCGAGSSVRSYCLALRSDLSSYISSVRTVASIANALKTTVFRESAAAATRNRSALRRQDANGKQLESQLQHALATEIRLGATLARLIASKHVQGQLTQAQAQAAVAYIVGQLRRRSIPLASIDKLASTALHTGPISLLTQLR